MKTREEPEVKQTGDHQADCGSQNVERSADEPETGQPDNAPENEEQQSNEQQPDAENDAERDKEQQQQDKRAFSDNEYSSDEDSPQPKKQRSDPVCVVRKYLEQQSAQYNKLYMRRIIMHLLSAIMLAALILRILRTNVEYERKDVMNGLHYRGSVRPKQQTYEIGGPFLYLSFINLILQLVYAVLATLNDFFGTNEIILAKNTGSMFRLYRDFIFVHFAFPVCLCTSVPFWIMQRSNFPKEMDGVMSDCHILNTLVHLSPLFMVMYELWTTYHEYPEGYADSYLTGLFMCCYLYWLQMAYDCNGNWPYDILEKSHERWVTAVAATVIATLSYVICKFANTIYWGHTTRYLRELQKCNNYLDFKLG